MLGLMYMMPQPDRRSAVAARLLRTRADRSDDDHTPIDTPTITKTDSQGSRHDKVPLAMYVPAFAAIPKAPAHQAMGWVWHALLSPRLPQNTHA